MPIFIYRCEDCDDEEEVLVMTKKDELKATVCPFCMCGYQLIPGSRKKIMCTSSYVMKGFNEKNGYSNESS
jgi:predicted nucleic acid-binding Zn ribbon protein